MVEDVVRHLLELGELDDEASEFNNEIVESRDLISEDLVGGAAAQAEKRGTDLEELYPFEVLSGRLRHSDNAMHWAYGFCLAAALANQFDSQLKRKIRACFEILVRDVLEAYFGADTGGFRTGHPWDIYSTEHFMRTKQVYRALFVAAKDSLDWMWTPRPDHPADPNYRREKDLGVDVVVWKNMPDNRGGRLYILAQCATTENNLVGKCGDIKPRRLQNYMTLPDVKIIQALATPTCMLNSVEIRAVSRDGGLVFDRSRLVKIVNSSAWTLRDRTSEVQCKNLFAEVIEGL